MIMNTFRNRITQESEATIRKLKSAYINFNYDDDKKKTTPNTPNGLFMITIQPNTYVDDIVLEHNFKHIINLYYRWRYGTRWYKKQHLQYEYVGIIEQQAGFTNHIHFIIYDWNIEKLSMFYMFITTLFKYLYAKSSFNIERVYDIDKCKEYVSIVSYKDKYVSKRRVRPSLQLFYQRKQINNYGTNSCSN